MACAACAVQARGPGAALTAEHDGGEPSWLPPASFAGCPADSRALASAQRAPSHALVGPRSAPLSPALAFRVSRWATHRRATPAHRSMSRRVALHLSPRLPSLRTKGPSGRSPGERLSPGEGAAGRAPVAGRRGRRESAGRRAKGPPGERRSPGEGAAASAAPRTLRGSAVARQRLCPPSGQRFCHRPRSGWVRQGWSGRGRRTTSRGGCGAGNASASTGSAGSALRP